MINEKELSEITIESDDAKICIKGKKCPPPMPMPMAMPMSAPAVSEAPKADAPKAVSGNVVKSPIVGTFYSAPAPDKAPFVTVGQQVNKGDVLFIIESMKVMSEVQSEFSGVVKEILVNNADPLEFEQPVMIIG
jgi:acetyl-CoA carboxylase biotin carboxyl carrier protein